MNHALMTITLCDDLNTIYYECLEMTADIYKCTCLYTVQVPSGSEGAEP